MDERGCTVKERVEQACEETKELIRQLESKIRTQSLVDTSLHTLEPASMIRQVCRSLVDTSLHTLEPASMVRQVGL